MAEKYKCDRCGNQINPYICWCGQNIEGHGYGEGGHSPIPMGCNCGRAKVKESSDE